MGLPAAPAAGVLIPILYMVQELTVRLGSIHRQRSRRAHQGDFWPDLGVGFSGRPGGGDHRRSAYRTLRRGRRRRTLWRSALAQPGARRRRAARHRHYRLLPPRRAGAIAFGLFEFAFFGVAWAPIRISATVARQSVAAFRFATRSYLYLVAANIGAVIMPWMVFYQQSAVADKKLRPNISRLRAWTRPLGAVLTQLVMAAVLSPPPPRIGRTGQDQPFEYRWRPQRRADALPWPRRRASGVWAGHHRRRHGGGHRRLTGPCLGPWRSHWLQALPRTPPASRRAGSMAIYAVCVIGGCLLVAVAPEPGVAQRRRAGDERVPAAAGAWLPRRAGRQGAATAHRLQGWYLWLVIAVASPTCLLGVFGGLSGSGMF